MLGDNRYGEMDSLLNREPSWAVFAGGARLSFLWVYASNTQVSFLFLVSVTVTI